MPKLTTGILAGTTQEPAMKANAWGKLRSLLARNGYSQRWIKDTIGSNLGGRDKAEIIPLLYEGMRTAEAKAARNARFTHNVISNNNRNRF